MTDLFIMHGGAEAQRGPELCQGHRAARRGCMTESTSARLRPRLLFHVAEAWWTRLPGWLAGRNVTHPEGRLMRSEPDPPRGAESQLCYSRLRPREPPALSGGPCFFTVHG